MEAALNQGSRAGDQGTGRVRSRGGGTSGGRLYVQWLSQGSASTAAVAKSGLGTGRQQHREGIVSAAIQGRRQSGQNRSGSDGGGTGPSGGSRHEQGSGCGSVRLGKPRLETAGEGRR